MLYIICFFLVVFGIGMGKYYDEAKSGPSVLLFSVAVQTLCFLIPSPIINNYLTQLIVFFIVAGYLVKHEYAAVWGAIIGLCNAIAMNLDTKLAGAAQQEFFIVFTGACVLSLSMWATIRYALPKMGPLPDSFPDPLIKLRQALCRHNYEMTEPLNEPVYEEGCAYNLIRNRKCAHCDHKTQIGSGWIYC